MNEAPNLPWGVGRLRDCLTVCHTCLHGAPQRGQPRRSQPGPGRQCPAARSSRGGKAVEQHGRRMADMGARLPGFETRPRRCAWASYFRLAVPQFPYLQNGANKSTRSIELLMMMTCITTVHVRCPAQCLARCGRHRSDGCSHSLWGSALVSPLLGEVGASRGVCSHTVGPLGDGCPLEQVTPHPYHPAFSSVPPAWSLWPCNLRADRSSVWDSRGELTLACQSPSWSSLCLEALYSQEMCLSQMPKRAHCSVP